MEPFRVAVVGAGRWGEVLIRTIKRLRGLELRRIVTSRLHQNNSLPEHCQISRHWREALSDPEIDGIIVATPPHTHFEIADAALHAGKSVLVEKPVALSVSEAERLHARAEKSNGKILVDHIHLFSPAFRAMCNLLSGAGPILSIRSRGGNHGPFRQQHPVLWDWATHDVAMCLHLLDRSPSRIELLDVVYETHRHGPGEHYDFKLYFGDSPTAHIKTGNLMDRKQRWFEVRTRDSIYIYDDIEARKLSVSRIGGNGDTIETFCPEYDDELPVDRLLIEFVELARSRSTDLESIRLGVDVARILDTISNYAAAQRFDGHRC